MKETLATLLAAIMLLAMLGASAQAQEKITLEFWALDGSWNPWFEDAINAYNEASDKYFINMSIVDYSTYNERMNAARHAGNAPDLSMDNFSDLAWGYNAGYYCYLEELLPQEVIDDLFDNVVEMCTFDGHLIAYPQHTEPAVVMYYNKQMFADAGIEKVPTTWDELLAAAEKLTSTYTFGVHFNRNWNLWSWENSFGKHWPVNDEWSAADCQDENYVNMVKAIAGLYTSGWAPETELHYYDQAIYALADESAAIVFCGSWAIGTIYSSFPEIADNVGVAPAPTLDGEPFAGTLGGWCILAESTTKSPEGCGDFIAKVFGGDPEMVAGFNKSVNYSKYTTRQSVSDYLATAPIEDENIKTWLNTINTQIIPYCGSEPTYAWDFSQAIIDAVNNVIMNKVSAEDALQIAADTINKYIQVNEYWNKKPN